MRLVIDDKIPYLRGKAERLGEVIYKNGADITPADVKQADALVVRTRTRVNEALLQGSSVKLVVTATIGYDHLDTAYLQRSGIAWHNCPGCNATSVAQYVKCALLLLAAHGCWGGGDFTPAHAAPTGESDFTNRLRGLTIGIIGVGHVGTEVARAAKSLGLRLLLCDPPRQAAGHEPPCGVNHFMNLKKMLPQCDVVTLHTPLTRLPAPFATEGMAAAAFFESLKPGAVFINTSRGETVDEAALLRALDEGRVRAAVIDTWQNEPHISAPLLAKAFLATPHIAGYSADGKANGSRRALEAVASHFGLPARFDDVAAPPLPPAPYAYHPQGTAASLHPDLRLYDSTLDSLSLKHRPETFEALRGHYPLRREHDC